MAASKTVESTFGGDNGYIQLTLTETASSVEDNKSTWTAALKFVYTQNVASSATKSYSMTINGTTYSGTFTVGTSSSGVTKTLRTVTGISVSHNTDGSKSFAVSFSVGVNLTLSGTYYGTITGSGTVTATTIARATVATLSSSSVNLGSSVTISLPRASTAFTHKIEQNVSGSYATATSSAGTSYTLTADTSWGDYFPSATSKTVTIRVTTYNGTTEIGSMTLTLTVKITSTMIPTISSITATEATSGLASTFGCYIQNKSTIKIVTAAAGIYGSTIKSYTVTCDGGTYSGSTVTTNAITSSGSITITVKVTDSRGKTATSTTTISVVAYSNPAISIFRAYRCDADGTANAKGTSLGSYAKFDISEINDLNTSSVKLAYRLRDTTALTTAFTGEGYTCDEALPVEEGVLGTGNSYDVRLTISDYFTSTSVTVTISTAFTLMNWYKNGIAIGKQSEIDGTFEVDLPTKFFQDVIIGDVNICDSLDIKSITLDSIEMTSDSSLEDICAAMPDKTSVTFDVGTSSAYVYAYAVCHILRMSVSRCIITLSSAASTSQRVAHNSWRSDRGLYGWREDICVDPNYIVSGADLNNYIYSGAYLNLSATNTGSNYPEETYSGMLEVYAFPNGTIFQTWTARDSLNTYKRRRQSGTWGSWKGI